MSEAERIKEIIDGLEHALKSERHRYEYGKEPMLQTDTIIPIINARNYLSELQTTALRAQEQNEPLTVVPFVITMANGEPVDYKALGKRYRKEILEHDIDGIYVNEDGGMVLMDDCGHCVWLNRDEFAITREPKGADQ